jgi:hypothetical protein
MFVEVGAVASSSPLDITFDRNGNLHVRVRMTGNQRTFASGNRGYSFRERFDWDARSWRLNLSAVVKESETETTLGLLTDVPYEDNPSSVPGASKLEELVRRSELRRIERARGWHLARVADGVEGWFELSKIYELPQAKMGSFASFYLELNGILYYGAFNLSEYAPRQGRPTTWDHSKGARAGIPSLGKRR